MKMRYTTLIADEYFSETFGGWRNPVIYLYGGKDSGYWSASSENDNKAWIMSIRNNTQTADMFKIGKSWGFSVRCIKN